MATIYYSRDSIINSNDTVDVWVDAFIDLDVAKERVIELNSNRTEEDYDNNVKYHYLLRDWDEPAFYDEGEIFIS